MHACTQKHLGKQQLSQAVKRHDTQIGHVGKFPLMAIFYRCYEENRYSRLCFVNKDKPLH
jgi:hypothetical protein